MAMGSTKPSLNSVYSPIRFTRPGARKVRVWKLMVESGTGILLFSAGMFYCIVRRVWALLLCSGPKRSHHAAAWKEVLGRPCSHSIARLAGLRDPKGSGEGHSGVSL